LKRNVQLSTEIPVFQKYRSNKQIPCIFIFKATGIELEALEWRRVFVYIAGKQITIDRELIMMEN
jgi:hypothetical protein